MLTDQTLENSWKLLLPMANLKRTETTNNVFENVHLHVHVHS